MQPLTDCIRLTDIAPAKCQQTRYRSEFTAASRGFPATAWLSCVTYLHCTTRHMQQKTCLYYSDEINRVHLLFIKPTGATNTSISFLSFSQVSRVRLVRKALNIHPFTATHCQCVADACLGWCDNSCVRTCTSINNTAVYYSSRAVLPWTATSVVNGCWFLSTGVAVTGVTGSRRMLDRCEVINMRETGRK